MRHVLSGARLRIEQRIENTSDVRMPFAFGFHPYFAVRDADKAKTRIPTTAKRAFDNVTKAEVDVTGPIDLAQKEVDLHLFDHGKNEASLDLADGSRVIVRASPEYHRWVIWTLAGKDFVCLEPWTAAADALNREHQVLVVAPGETKELFVEIEAA
jgi:galactose mutarotase-like enzyme